IQIWRLGWARRQDLDWAWKERRREREINMRRQAVTCTEYSWLGGAAARRRGVEMKSRAARRATACDVQLAYAPLQSACKPPRCKGCYGLLWARCLGLQSYWYGHPAPADLALRPFPSV